MAKQPPPVVFASMEEAQALLKPQAFDPEAPAALAEGAEPAPRGWKRHFCNVFGDCSAHDWAHCCVSYWVPCVGFGRNMRRALSLNAWAQALVYLVLFGGLARVMMGVADHQCPMWEVNPEYVAIHGKPDFPPPAGFPMGHHHHHHHHPHGGPESHRHHEHPFGGMEPRFHRDGDAVEAVPDHARPVVEMEVEVEFERNTPEAQPVPMAAVMPAEEVAAEDPKEKLANALNKIPMIKKIKEAAEHVEERKHAAHFEEMKKAGEHESAAMRLLKKISKAVAGPAHAAWAQAHAQADHERRGLKEGPHGGPHAHDGKPPHGHHETGPHPYIPVKKCVHAHLGVFGGCVLVALIAAIYAGARRSQIREKFGIAGSRCCDFLAWAMCPFCALTQESRTLSHHNVEDGVWPEQQYAPVPTVVVMEA